jgi:hypothetical protein
MKPNGLRNFTVRFRESELERVQTIAKPFYGGRLSTGEAIRRLTEERLDEITHARIGKSLRETVLRLLSDWCARRRRAATTFPIQ